MFPTKFHAARRILISPLLMVLFLSLACSPPAGRRGVRTDTLETATAPSAETTELLDKAQRALAAGDSDAARAFAEAAWLAAPQGAAAPMALSIAAQAAIGQGDQRAARSLHNRLVESFPRSPQAAGAWRALAVDATSRADFLEGAMAFGEALDQETDIALQRRDRLELQTLFRERLSDADLQAVDRRFRDGPVAEEAQRALIFRRIERGDSPRALAGGAKDFLDRFPDSPHAPEVQGILIRLNREAGIELPAGLDLLRPDRIGLLCPLSGEYADLGQELYDGALLALEEFNRRSGTQLTLISRDTRGDEVEAVHQARALLDEDGVIGLVGALLSAETVAVATLAQERLVPLVSPTATKETIGSLGGHIFQANPSRAIEARLLAQASTGLLQRSSVAILHPLTEEGQRDAEAFADELRRHGGSVVAMESYARGATDFGEVIAKLRDAAPQALYVAASPLDMRLIAPQLTFHGLSTQLLGPSSWNNRMLARDFGADMDRAIFPSDVALIPEAERSNFQRQWERRHGQRPASEFALKGWFSVRCVADALGQGARTHSELRDRLAARLLGGLDGVGVERLRVMDEGQILAFPAGLFPGGSSRTP